MKNDSFNLAASGNGADDMPKFVDGHHCQPAQGQEAADQQKLVKAFHVGFVFVIRAAGPRRSGR